MSTISGNGSQAEEFRRLSSLVGEGESDKEVLFCHGDPGVDKTFIRYYNKDYTLG